MPIDFAAAAGILKQVPQFIKEPKTLWTVLLFSALLAFAPESCLNSLHISALVLPLRSWLALATVLAIVVLIVEAVYTRISERKYAARVNTLLDSLSENELFLLAYCVRKHRMTVNVGAVSRWGNTADGLVGKGLMYPSTGSTDALPYTVRMSVWKILLSHTKIGDTAKALTPEVIERMDAMTTPTQGTTDTLW